MYLQCLGSRTIQPDSRSQSGHFKSSGRIDSRKSATVRAQLAMASLVGNNNMVVASVMMN